MRYPGLDVCTEAFFGSVPTSLMVLVAVLLTLNMVIELTVLALAIWYIRSRKGGPLERPA